VKRYLCWQPESAFAIINPDADALADPIFRAVHTDLPVRLQSGISGVVKVVTPTEFLAEVLRPQDHLLVPVIGKSGTGKSHLIRWLELKLRAAAGQREVIYVRKAQTNLRDIVISLVERLPLEDQEPYRNALAVAGGASLSPEAQRTAILNQLHLALVNDQGASDPKVDMELEAYALSGLRAMFIDPYLRKFLLADAGFAAELAAHVFEKPERYEPKEGRREFGTLDFPLDVRELRKAARETQDFLAWLLDAPDADRQVVVSLINRHLDWAIANCLNMTGDRVIELMSDLRRHLRSRGRELVLLIEDFARLQGLDRALLQSIIEQRPDLCVLRTVFASTGGFFSSIVETVRTRVTYTVDMDARTHDGQLKLDGFVARYLNAVRLGKASLSEQWEEVESGGVDFDVPSKCTSCQYRDECHRAFGAVDGKGLYPLTPQAITIMAERADPKYSEHFNPREFQRHALRPVALAGDTLRTGQFPPPSLLDGLGGRTMSETVATRLRRDDPAHAARRLTFLELWGGGGNEVRNLGAALHTAFDLPLLANVETTDDLILEPSPSEQTPGVESPTEDARLGELQAWSARTKPLSSKTANDLRPLVFEALEKYIDWDDWGLARTAFFGRTAKSAAFRQRDIAFQEQATQPSAGRYSLLIPKQWSDEAERSRVTLALQGLLQAKTAGDWAFPDGLEKLACLSECLRDWSKELLRQFRQSGVDENGQDLAATAFELRATLQILLNPQLGAGSNQEILVAGLVPGSGATADFATPELNTLVTELDRHQMDLHDRINSRYSAQKGGDAGGFMDTARLLPIAKGLRARRLLPPTGNPAARGRHDSAEPWLAVAHKWSGQAQEAFARESGLRVSLRRQLEASFGERPLREGVFQFLQRLSVAAGTLGVAGVQDLLTARASLESLPFDDLVSSLRDVDPETLDPRELRSGIGRAARACEELIRRAGELLARTEIELDARLKREGVDPESKQRLVQDLGADLNKLDSQFERYADVDLP
jgi:hypothetical protein